MYVVKVIYEAVKYKKQVIVKIVVHHKREKMNVNLVFNSDVDCHIIVALLLLQIYYYYYYYYY